jgi:hypothetical protein
MDTEYIIQKFYAKMAEMEEFSQKFLSDDFSKSFLNPKATA